jgi:hypothetical protein
MPGGFWRDWEISHLVRVFLEIFRRDGERNDETETIWGWLLDKNLNDEKVYS